MFQVSGSFCMIFPIINDESLMFIVLLINNHWHESRKYLMLAFSDSNGWSTFSLWLRIRLNGDWLAASDNSLIVGTSSAQCCEEDNRAVHDLLPCIEPTALGYYYYYYMYLITLHKSLQETNRWSGDSHVIRSWKPVRKNVSLSQIGIVRV